MGRRTREGAQRLVCGRPVPAPDLHHVIGAEHAHAEARGRVVVSVEEHPGHILPEEGRSVRGANVSAHGSVRVGDREARRNRGVKVPIGPHGIVLDAVFVVVEACVHVVHAIVGEIEGHGVQGVGNRVSVGIGG